MTYFLLNFSHWELPFHSFKAGAIQRLNIHQTAALYRAEFYGHVPICQDRLALYLRTASEDGIAGTTNADYLEREQLLKMK